MSVHDSDGSEKKRGYAERYLQSAFSSAGAALAASTVAAACEADIELFTKLAVDGNEPFGSRGSMEAVEQLQTPKDEAKLSVVFNCRSGCSLLILFCQQLGHFNSCYRVIHDCSRYHIRASAINIILCIKR